MTISKDTLDMLRRNSDIGLDREGRWTFRGALVENPRVQALFHQGLSIDDDGHPVLKVGQQWCYVQHVEDTVFFIQKVRNKADGIELVLLDQTTEQLEPSTLSMRDDKNLYCRLGSGHKARFLRDALFGLAPWLVDKGDRIGLLVGGQFYECSPE